MIELAVLATQVAQKGGIQVIGKTGTRLLTDIIGLQDRQLVQLEEIQAKLGQVAVMVDQLRQRPLHTARLHLDEASSAPDEARPRHVERAAEYLLEAYGGEGDAAMRALVARELALVKQLVGHGADLWWIKAVQDAFEAVESACARLLELLGTPRLPPDNVSSDDTAFARKDGIRIRGKLVYGFDDATRFWYLVGRHLAAIEDGERISDAPLDALPQTRAIYGLHELHVVAQETRAAALAGGVDPDRLPECALRVYLGRRQNVWRIGNKYPFLLSDDQMRDHAFPAAEVVPRERAEYLRRYLRTRRRIPRSYMPTPRQLVDDHPEVAGVWTVRWLWAATRRSPPRRLTWMDPDWEQIGVDGDVRLGDLSDDERTRLLERIGADHPIVSSLLDPWTPGALEFALSLEVGARMTELSSRLAGERDWEKMTELLEQIAVLKAEEDVLDGKPGSQQQSPGEL